MGIGKVAQAAVFLDRDGVLNALVLNPATGRMESPLTPEDLRLCRGVVEALFRLQQAGYPLILVSNQPNYALGKCSLDMLSRIHHKLVCELLGAGITFSRFCYCLHHPQGVTPGFSGLCVCRKPSPWFLLRARDDFRLSMARSWMIGDQPTDVQCGKAAGTRTIRIDGNCGGSDPLPVRQHPGPHPDCIATNLTEAAQTILSQDGC